MMVMTGTPPTWRTAAESKGRFLFLDGLRGIAALSIVFYHIPEIFRGSTIIPHAWLAVDFFFMLSGFVIAYAYDDRLRNGSLTALSFISRRVIRLYPLIIVGAVVATALLIAHHAPARKIAPLFGTGVLQLPLLGSGRISIARLNPPSWSLFFELGMSVCYGLLAIKRVKERMLWIVAGFCLGAMSVWVLVSGQGNLGVDTQRFWWGFVRVAGTFLTGVLIQHFHKRGLVSALQCPKVIVTLVLLATFFFPNDRFRSAFEVLSVVVIYPSLLIFGANEVTQGVAEAGTYKWAGELSYPVYVLHWPILSWTKWTFNRSGLAPSGLLLSPALMLAVSAQSAIALVGLDRPARTWLTRLLRRRPQLPPG